MRRSRTSNKYICTNCQRSTIVTEFCLTCGQWTNNSTKKYVGSYTSRESYRRQYHDKNDQQSRENISNSRKGPQNWVIVSRHTPGPHTELFRQPCQTLRSTKTYQCATSSQQTVKQVTDRSRQVDLTQRDRVQVTKFPLHISKKIVNETTLSIPSRVWEVLLQTKFDRYDTRIVSHYNPPRTRDNSTTSKLHQYQQTYPQWKPTWLPWNRGDRYQHPPHGCFKHTRQNRRWLNNNNSNKTISRWWRRPHRVNHNYYPKFTLDRLFSFIHVCGDFVPMSNSTWTRFHT